jgi:nitroreductase
MEALEAIMSRKSVREFEAKPVPEEAVKKMLAAAMQAPSARKGLPWHFVVVTDRKKLAALKEFHPHAAMAADAPLGILVCADTSNERSRGYFVHDCAAATENLLLAAHALGLGGVWTGVHPSEGRMEGFRRLFGIPAHVAPISFAVIGYPKAKEAARPRYDEERVHMENWQRA